MLFLRRVLGTCAVIGSAAFVASCSAGPPPQVEADYPAFSSISELADQADLVVTGTVVDVLGREVDGGGEDETVDAEGNPNGVPMVFYRFAVARVLGGVPSGEEIVLGWIDLDRVGMDGVSRIARGADTLLFLRHMPDADSPGVTSVADFYVPVSADNGVFDVRGQVAAARSPLVERVSASSARNGQPGSRLEAPLEDIAAVVRQVK